MKVLRFLLCFFLLGGLSFFNGNAQTLTREQAQALASEFFAQGTRATRSVSPTLAYQWDSRHLSPVATIAAEEAAPAFYAFARESGEGFVIISSDANNPRVLGYSLDSNLPDVQNLPDGMRDFLTEYSVAPAQTKQSRASYNATSMGKIVVNLNTAPWGQSAPFNKLCFTSTGQQAKTGCVPTAYSILMHYHKWPVAAKPVTVYHSGTGEKITLGYEYDWAKMLHSYSGTYKEEQADAMATLMRDVGYAYEVVYGTGSTESGGKGEGAGTLIDVFKYKSETPSNTSGNHTRATVRDILGNDALWKQYIQQSLDAGLPIPYSSTGDGNLKHIFILDGYTDNGYYHFNWGWNGNGNGWFTLSNMSLDDGSNYSKSHKAYFMLSPNRGEPCTITVSTDCGTCGTVSASYGSTEGESITVDQGANVTLTATPYSGYIFEKWTCGTEDVSTSATCKVSANSSAEYVAHFVAVSATYQISTSVFGDEGGTAMLQIEGDEPTTNGDVIPGREVTLIAEPEEGYQFVKWTSGTNDISNEATYTFVPNASAQYVAHFEVITHTVGVSTSDAVFGLVQIDGATPAESASKEVNYGTEVTLTAEPKSGYVFKHWTSGGDVVSIDNPLRVDVTDDVNYVAVFIPQSQNTGVSIVATTDGGGTATVNSNNSVNAERNEEITLAATPASGYYFVEWRVGEEVVSTKATFTTSAQTARTYKAVFAALPAGNATINAYGRGGGNASVQNMTGTALGSTGVSLPYGTTFKLVAQKTGNVDFKCWTKNTTVAYGGEIISNDMEIEVVATETMKYFANFAATTSVSATASANTGGTAEVTGDKTYAGEVTFKAAANTGYNFTNWTNAGGQVVSTEPYYTTLLTSDLALTANFEVSGSVPTPETYNISVSVNGTNGTAAASSNSVTEGQTVTLTATPNDGYRFVNWTKGTEVVSSANPYTFVPTASGDYVANFEKILETYTINASVNSTNGTATASSNSVTQGQSVTLTATPMNGYRFVNWTKGGEVVSTDNPYTFVPTVSGDYVANFEKILETYTINASVNSTNGTAAASSNSVTEGQSVTLTATPMNGYRFVNWTKGGEVVSTDNPYTFVPTASGDYVANFEAIPVYNISTSVNGTNGTAAASSNSVTEGEEVTLTATPNDGYRFVNWTKGTEVVSSANPYTFVPTASGEYMANFEAIPVVTPQYTISVASSDNGFGSVAVLEFGTSVSGTVDAGTPLTLVATPIETCKFVKWTCNGQDIEGGATLEVTASENADYVAVFAVKESYYVSISSNPSGAGEISISVGTNYSETGMYVLEGAIVTLQATANAGYTFKNWTRDGVEISKDESFSVPVDAAADYVANFESVSQGTGVTISAVASDGGSATVNSQTTISGVEVNTPLTLVATPNAGYYFVKWQVDEEDVSTKATFTTTAQSDREYRAVFAMGGEEVVVRSSGSLGNGYIGTIGTNQVSAVKGTSIKLLAVVVEKPFLCWTKGSNHTNGGEVLSNKMVFDVVVTERTTYIANFKDPISVSVEASVNGDGGTTEITGDKSYAGEVTFVANPQTGYKFTRWTNGGETVSTEPHYTTIVTGDLNLVANFEKMSVAPSEPETTGLDVNLTMISDDDELIYGLEGAIGTFSAPYATLIPENVDVYYALKSDLDGTDALHLIHYNTSATSTVIPANQGVILVGNFNVNTTVHMIPATDEQAGRMANNAFSNTAAGSEEMQTGDYVLARGEQGIGFYQATGILKPNKAFLRLGSASGVAAFRLVVGETTDLNSTVTIINPDAPIYDLSGRRVMQTVKGGVYIQNGKKFIVK